MNHPKTEANMSNQNEQLEFPRLSFKGGPCFKRTRSQSNSAAMCATFVLWWIRENCAQSTSLVPGAVGGIYGFRLRSGIGICRTICSGATDFAAVATC